MFLYIVNADDVVIAKVDNQPDANDLQKRNERVISTNIDIPLHLAECQNNIIVEKEVENIKTYDAKSFLASCELDDDLQDTLNKFSDRQYTKLSLCLQNANFEMLSSMVSGAVSGSLITQSEADYFSQKLFDEQSVNLEDYEV